MKKYIIIILTAFIFNMHLSAQFNKSFKNNYIKACAYADLKKYSEALSMFFKLDSLVPNNANINFFIGFCYFNISNEKIKSISYLEKAVEKVSLDYKGEYNEINAPINALQYLSKAYHIAERLEDEIIYLNKFRNYLSPSQADLITEINRQVEMCYNAKMFMGNPLDITVENLGENINTKYPEYSSIINISEDTLIFTSRRPGSTGGLKDDYGQFFEDIYFSVYDKLNKIRRPSISIGSNINTKEHEASISITPDGKQLFIYKDDNGDGNIYLSKMVDNEWSIPEKLPEPINTKAWETHACLSSDGITLYFVSDRPGGFGGRDIYKSIKQPDGSWSKPRNLGRKINTAYDEDSPFIVTDVSDTTILYFSSTGHQSMGGFDIFLSKKIGENIWTDPENLGYPVNTTDDDIFYMPTTDRRHAYYSSSKLGGYGDQDIYYLTIHGFKKERHIAKLKGTIVDVLTNKPVKSTIILKNDNKQIAEINTSETNSNFEVVIDKGKKYNITVMADTYVPYDGFVEISSLDSNRNTEIFKRILMFKVGQSPPTESDIDISTLAQQQPKSNVDTAELIHQQHSEPIIDLSKAIQLPSTKTNIDTSKFVQHQQQQQQPPPNTDLPKVVQPQDLTMCYTVQIAAGYNIKQWYFEKAINYKMIECNDGLKRYLMGEYNDKEEAIKQKQKMIFLGYEDAFVRECFTTSSFKPSASGKTLEKIYFDFDRFNIRNDAFVVLEKVVQLMNENISAHLEISGHTDNIGSDEYNQGLSERRSVAALNYFIQKGVEKQRISFKGFSFKIPVAPNTTIEGRQMNRRDEFKLVGN